MTGLGTMAGIKLEVAFASNPLAASPTWTDVSTYVRSWGSDRGRSVDNPLGAAGGQFQSGSFAVTLNNNDGRFDPANTGSPYSPNVLPMRRIRIRASAPGSTALLPVFDGYVNQWPQTYPMFVDNLVTLSATDSFKILGQYPFIGNAPSEWASQRVARMVNAAGLGTANINSNGGETTMVALSKANTTALQASQDAELSEAGAFYIDASGNATFEPRFWRWTNNSSTAVQYVFDDTQTAGTVGYIDIQPQFDDTYLYNSAVVTDGGGTVFTYSDAASTATYGTRAPFPIQTQSIDPNQGYDYAAWIVINQKDAKYRVPSITFNPQRAGAGNAWSAALNLDISDLVTVRRHPDYGGTISGNFFIENISHAVTPSSWQTTLGLAPVPTNLNPVTAFATWGGASTTWGGATHSQWGF